MLTERCEEYRRLGCNLVQVGGKGQLLQPAAIALHLKIPTAVVIFDSDAHEDDTQRLELHRKENAAILKLFELDAANPLPNETLWDGPVIMWKSELGEIVREEFGNATYTSLIDQVMSKQKLFSKGSLQKNGMFIGYLPNEAWQSGLRSKSLDMACETIIGFARAKSRQYAAAA